MDPRSRKRWESMSEVLVLVDHVDGAVGKPTYELLTIAKRLGEPSAVFIGDGSKASEVAEKVKKYGAEKVYVVDDAQIKGYLVAPKAEALSTPGLAASAWVARSTPSPSPWKVTRPERAMISAAVPRAIRRP